MDKNNTPYLNIDYGSIGLQLIKKGYTLRQIKEYINDMEGRERTYLENKSFNSLKSLKESKSFKENKLLKENRSKKINNKS